MKRAAGFCASYDCDNYAKATFLLNYGRIYICTLCKREGKIKEERGFIEGPTYIHDRFSTVKVEFNYEFSNDKYMEMAIVTDNDLKGLTYVYQTPLIKTDSRALKVAEAMLSNLNMFGATEDFPKQTEQVLTFDDDFVTFQEKLGEISKLWSKI